MKWRSAGKSDIGRVRTGNEDAFFTDEGRGVFIVADGMGGHAAGEVASQIVSEMVGPGVSRAVERGLEAEALKNEALALIGKANRAILQRADHEPEKRGMGTTLTLLTIMPAGHYLFGQVGDSRGYLLRDGKLKQVTRDHTVVQQQVDQGALTPEQARDHPLSHILTRALGTEEKVQADTYFDAAQPGDRFLLCSDGLSGMLPDEQIWQILSTSTDDLQQIADTLVEAANQAGGLDNVTALIVEIAP